MERIRESERGGGLGAAVITPEVLTPPGMKETAHSPCRRPTTTVTDLAMRDVDAALAADPPFLLCPEGRESQVDVRYWYFHPLNLSCRHRVAHRTGHPVMEG